MRGKCGFRISEKLAISYITYGYMEYGSWFKDKGFQKCATLVERQIYRDNKIERLIFEIFTISIF